MTDLDSSSKRTVTITLTHKQWGLLHRMLKAGLLSTAGPDPATARHVFSVVTDALFTRKYV